MNPNKHKRKMLELAAVDIRRNGQIHCHHNAQGCVAVYSWDEHLSDEAIDRAADELHIYPPQNIAGSKNQWLRALPELAIRFLELDHVDNLKGDEDKNLQLICRPCNERKNPNTHPRKRRFDSAFEQYTLSMERKRKEAEKAGIRFEFKTLLRNTVMEPRFRDAGSQILRKHGSLPVDEFIPAACQDAGNSEETISPVTGAKYFSKLASRYAKTAIWETYEDGDDELRVTMVRLKKKGGKS